ncbi:hypothetical protein NA57DRAFT_74303 [Rhizodiscina lignyota]|uniref:Essential protein Yae1 N-terminal domain-containing protein n=1 Tax=Rhizodiscina lignyota TaxID=1504668 RepID=A0A9P4M853_9PEZI|nr:hypothetical protein NA57DRAFT_74303 [Rhizodiscina lignyota]
MAPESNGDPFDSLLNLEDQYYSEGYEQGVADGSRAGRIEGRIFGLEKGFEKFVAMGKLHGKATIWTQRLEKIKNQYSSESGPESSKDDQELVPDTALASAMEEASLNDSAVKLESRDSISSPRTSQVLSPLPSRERLERHIRTLHALTEPATFSTQNDEDSVADFDDRLKRAEAKIRLITNLTGDNGTADQEGNESLLKASGSSPNPKRKVVLKREETQNDGNIEDFGNINSKARSGD